MQQNLINNSLLWLLPLLIIITLLSCGTQSALCTKVNADRIVFPDEYQHLSTNSEKTVLDKEKKGNFTDKSILQVTTPRYIEQNTTDSNENATTLQPTEEMPTVMTTLSTEEVPESLDNRIALDTLPKCPPGYGLIGRRCRKEA